MPGQYFLPVAGRRPASAAASVTGLKSSSKNAAHPLQAVCMQPVVNSPAGQKPAPQKFVLQKEPLQDVKKAMPGKFQPRCFHATSQQVLQRKIGFEFELGGISTAKNPTHRDKDDAWIAHKKGEVLAKQTGYNITADISHSGSQVEFVTGQFNEEDAGDLDKLTTAAQSIYRDIINIYNAARKGDGETTADKVAGISGSQWEMFIVQVKSFAALSGQLQMTGGINISALPDVVSGKAMPQSEVGFGKDKQFQDYAQRYQAAVPDTGELKQPLYQAAIGQVNGFVQQVNGGRLPGKASGIIAAVLALMAQIPLNARGDLDPGQGQLLARTDYSKILRLFSENTGLYIDAASFATALLGTINSMASTKVNAGDDVFPPAYKAVGQSLTGLSVKDWATHAVPVPGKLWGMWQGKDMVTKKHFPGTPAQKDVLKTFGEFGDKTDPGKKLILEWRNLETIIPAQLEMMMKGLAAYLANVNKG